MRRLDVAVSAASDSRSSRLFESCSSTCPANVNRYCFHTTIECLGKGDDPCLLRRQRRDRSHRPQLRRSHLISVREKTTFRGSTREKCSGSSMHGKRLPKRSERTRLRLERWLENGRFSVQKSVLICPSIAERRAQGRPRKAR